MILNHIYSFIVNHWIKLLHNHCSCVRRLFWILITSILGQMKKKRCHCCPLLFSFLQLKVYFVQFICYLGIGMFCEGYDKGTLEQQQQQQKQRRCLNYKFTNANYKSHRDVTQSYEYRNLR